jgi:uncharacterized membrane protein (DUF4010 family)
VDKPRHQKVTLRNPFAFWPVIAFALFLGIVILLARRAVEWLGGTGAVAGAIIAGIADVDAVSIAVAKLAPNPLDPRYAAIAILAAVAMNTLTKAAIAGTIGHGLFAKHIFLLTAACFAAGALGLWVTLARASQ